MPGRALNRETSGPAIRFVDADTDTTAIKSAKEAQLLNAKQLEIAVTMAGIGIFKFDIATETLGPVDVHFNRMTVAAREMRAV